MQLRARDVMWQKERLLNIALEFLPKACEKLVWLDCDLVYMRRDWSSEMVRLLVDYPIVQGFRRLYYLARDACVERFSPGDESHQVHSLTSRIAAGTGSIEDIDRSRRGVFGCGFAWGGRRSLLECCGFFDTNIVGGGDTAFFCAAAGRFERVIATHFYSERRARGYLDWAEPFFSAVGGRVGFIDADILHLWHGSLDNR